MTQWFTADLHADHENIRRHCGRPFATLDEMNAALVKNWNDRVSQKDEVFILGDFAWRNHAHWLGALKGKKHLVVGNHDKMSLDVLKNFTSVSQILQKQFDKHMVVLCHFPMRSWNGRVHGSWHLFGHVHGRLNRDLLPHTMDVGVDCNRFAPVSWDEVVEYIETEEYFRKKEKLCKIREQVSSTK